MAAHPKLEPVRDRKYLDSLRSERCLFTGVLAQPKDPVIPAHVGTLGKGIKSPDNEAIPLLSSIHQYGHQHSEIAMIRERIPDDVLRDALRALARERYAEWKAQQ